MIAEINQLTEKVEPAWTYPSIVISEQSEVIAIALSSVDSDTFQALVISSGKTSITRNKVMELPKQNFAPADWISVTIKNNQ